MDKLAQVNHLAKQRSAEDQRRVGLALTKKGKKTVSHAPGPAEGVLPEALSGLSHAGLLSLHRCLQAVIDQMELGLEDAADRPLSDL